MMDPFSYFSFQPVLHDWCNKGCGMWEPLLLKSSLCGGSGFPLSLSEWSFTICLTPYNRKYNVLSALLNKIFPSSFLILFNLVCFEQVLLNDKLNKLLLTTNRIKKKKKKFKAFFYYYYYLIFFYPCLFRYKNLLFGFHYQLSRYCRH